MQRSCGDSSNLVPAKCQRLVFCDTHPLCLPRHPVIVSGQANVIDQPSGLRQSPAPTKTSLILLPWWPAPHNSRVPHCLRQVEQIASRPGGESSQGAKRAKPSAAPHKPRKMSKFRWIRSTPYTLSLSVRFSADEGADYLQSEFEQTKLFACCCIYSECNGPAGGGVRGPRG